jgi:hypothetical protein
MSVVLDKIAIEQKLTALAEYLDETVDERLVYASVKPILEEFTQYAGLVSKYLKETEYEA